MQLMRYTHTRTHTYTHTYTHTHTHTDTHIIPYSLSIVDVIYLYVPAYTTHTVIP